MNLNDVKDSVCRGDGGDLVFWLGVLVIIGLAIWVGQSLWGHK